MSGCASTSSLPTPRLQGPGTGVQPARRRAGPGRCHAGQDDGAVQGGAAVRLRWRDRGHGEPPPQVGAAHAGAPLPSCPSASPGPLPYPPLVCMPGFIHISYPLPSYTPRMIQLCHTSSWERCAGVACGGAPGRVTLPCPHSQRHMATCCPSIATHPPIPALSVALHLTYSAPPPRLDLCTQGLQRVVQGLRPKGQRHACGMDGRGTRLWPTTGCTNTPLPAAPQLCSAEPALRRSSCLLHTPPRQPHP